MRKKKQPPSGKLLLRGAGAGALTEEDVELRAREIAHIAGRSRLRDEDREQARAELRNELLPATTLDDADGIRGVARDPSEPPARRGHQTPNVGTHDPRRDVERIVLEGVEEAQHEQMLADRRRRRTD